jgi:hypothetical protein
MHAACGFVNGGRWWQWWHGEQQLGRQRLSAGIFQQ